MAYIYDTYYINPVGLEKYSSEDLAVVNSFSINTKFKPFEHKAELHIYSIDEEVILRSIDHFKNIKVLLGGETAGQEGASEITLDPIEDAKQYGYSNVSVRLIYNFLDNLYSETQQGGKFYIEEISGDRTEIRLLTNQLENEEIEDYTQRIKDDLESNSYFDDFRLNVGNNDLLIGINIDIQEYREYNSVIVKLYEPLPENISVKDILTIEKVISDSVGYGVEARFIPEPESKQFLKGANFNVEVDSEKALPTDCLNYNDLFNFPTTNTYRELNSLANKKGIDLSIDYSDFSSFIHFSSAEERLKNFQYKLNLIETYQKNADSASSAITAGSTSFMSGSEKYWKGKIDTITSNFDHYDRHLYFGSGSTSWPKQEPQTKPYIQATGSATGSFATEYFSTPEASASRYDVSNNSYLLNTIPEYLREDPDSTQYLTFINMLGQHFDNIWIYAKALSDKYDNDNRLNFGVSKDLISDLLRNFGVKVYSSFKSTEDLFNVFTGKLYETGSDYTKSFVTASNEAISIENIESDIHKRIYHNLPYLLKTKGTERGLKALIASFGVPTNNTLPGSIGNINGLYVRTIGGGMVSGSLGYGPSLEFTSSLAKIKTDNTGSIATGGTLSNLTSVVQRDRKYSDDIHTVEVGYSPTYPLNDYIKGQLVSNFNIDDYIGDPRQAHSSSYELLISESNRVITQSSPHHYGEFVRILKFYDNALFKMIKDFVPARSNIDTGIIIKPHILERNKIKQVQGSFSTSSYLGEINTAFLSGSQAGAFTHRFNKEFKIPLTASYTESIVTPLGTAEYDYHLKERTRYDGEFSGSYIEVYEHSLNDPNTWKYGSPTSIQYKGELVGLITCPVVTTHTPIVSTVLAITGSGSITYTSDVSGGFAYSTTNATPTVSDNSTGNIFFGTGTYDHIITGLQTGSWYIRAFASSSGCGYTYGDVQIATISCPSISSLAASSIGTNEFSASGNFSSVGTGTFVEKGFIVWSGSSADKTHNDLADLLLTTSSTDSSTGNYTIPISGSNIIENLTHYYRAYASSSICVKYGDTVSLTTQAVTPATSSFFITDDSFESLSSMQGDAICGFGDGNYDETISAATVTEAYVFGTITGVAGLVEGKIIYKKSDNSKINSGESQDRLYGVADHSNVAASRWVNIGAGSDAGKIVFESGILPQSGIFPTGSVCTA